MSAMSRATDTAFEHHSLISRFKIALRTRCLVFELAEERRTAEPGKPPRSTAFVSRKYAIAFFGRKYKG